MADNSDDVIDLCDSFVLADHHGLTDVLIDLVIDDSAILDIDNSIVEFTGITHNSDSSNSALQSRRQKRDIELNPTAYINQKHKTKLKNQKIKNDSICKESENRFGDCPICFDALGLNPLASTKCGHVYCMKCLQQYLSFDQRCPTCRQILRGKSSYHPLYLNK